MVMYHVHIEGLRKPLVLGEDTLREALMVGIHTAKKVLTLKKRWSSCKVTVYWVQGWNHSDFLTEGYVRRTATAE